MIFMYVFGVVLAFTMALVFRFSLVKGSRTPLLLELPDYRWPSPRSLWFIVKSRVSIFIKEAGTVILALTILLWALFTFPNPHLTNSSLSTEETVSVPFGEFAASHLEESYAGQLGHLIEPYIEPLGFNWKIGIGLVASLAAREVFISTFGLLYGFSNTKEESHSLAKAMQREKDLSTGEPLYSPLVAISLLIFFAVSLQCMSTFAVTRKETGGWKWPLFQFGYLNALAWFLSFSVYQGGKFLGLG